MAQTKISKAFQTTISVEAIRQLGLRPGQRVNQIVEGCRLIIEPIDDVDALARSLRTPGKARSIEEMNVAAKNGNVKAGSAGLKGPK